MNRRERNPVKYTNREVETFLRNAENATVERIKDGSEQKAMVWKASFHSMVAEWAKKGHLTIKDFIFVLTSVAYELQTRVTQEEKE